MFQDEDAKDMNSLLMQDIDKFAQENSISTAQKEFLIKAEKAGLSLLHAFDKELTLEQQKYCLSMVTEYREKLLSQYKNKDDDLGTLWNSILESEEDTDSVTGTNEEGGQTKADHKPFLGIHKHNVKFYCTNKNALDIENTMLEIEQDFLNKYRYNEGSSFKDWLKILTWLEGKREYVHDALDKGTRPNLILQNMLEDDTLSSDASDYTLLESTHGSFVLGSIHGPVVVALSNDYNPDEDAVEAVGLDSSPAEL
jgi:hypothetical protein